jgi:hypothetical protein
MPAKIHEITVVGRIVSLQMSIPRDKSREPSSALMLVQWGPRNEETDDPLDFSDLGYFRLPQYGLNGRFEGLEEGQLVKINGHLQGTLRGRKGAKQVGIECIATRVAVMADW